MRGAREAILKSGMKLFAEKGYAGTSTREICQEAGITKPVLYYHFQGKEDLYQQLMVQIFSEDLDNILTMARKRGSLRQRLVHMVREDFRHVRANPVRVQFVLRMIFSAEDKRPYFGYIPEVKKQREVLMRVFQDAIDAGAAHGDPEELATALMGINLISVLEHQFTGRATLTHRRAERNVELVLKNCTP